MMKRGINTSLIVNLAQELPPTAVSYMSREDAYILLKHATGQDFGYEVRQWKIWLEKHPITPEDYVRAIVETDEENEK